LTRTNSAALSVTRRDPAHSHTYPLLQITFLLEDILCSAGDTIEFMLSAKRDVSAAKRFFKKLMRADHRRLPFTIGTDKHASYPEAFAASVKEKVLPRDCKLRRVKYLNNVIEQDHRAIRRR